MSISHRINSYFQLYIIILIERLPALLNIEMEVTAYERYFKMLCERFCLRLCRQYHAFYEEGDNYLDFEEECFKIIGCKLEHDTDFANQNYTDDKLASAEVILGYFHYTRAMDIISDGKCLLITNQRIYTTKEKFTRFDEISACTPTKNMLSTSLVFEKTDGKTIQLPVSKELAVPAADMINRLLSALKNEEYIAESVEMSESKALNATKSTILGAASSAKKGFSSLFGKKNKE